MYKAVKNGRCRGLQTGIVYKFHVGQTIDAPNGDISHSPGVQWIGAEPEIHLPLPPTRKTIIPNNMKPLSGTAKEIRAFLDKHNISYPAKARKPELIKILRNS